jgi:predicted metalloprotease with PDZ domain
MKFKQFLFLLIAGITSQAFADGGNDMYSYKVDITSVKDDKVKITLVPPKITTDEVIFKMPKMVPGTYKIYDFGRFVSNFSVNCPTNTNCNPTRIDDNSWKISNATKIISIEYYVEDTWDTEIKENKIFEPAGTEIDNGKCFVFNNHGFFGYFEGMTKKGYEVEVTRPDNFYASTGLTFTSNKNVDHFTTRDYDQLVDSPIMYTVPDTTFIQVGNCKVLVSVYNEPKSVVSSKVAEWIGSILDAQQNFLGGKLPVDKYAFLIYVPSEVEFGGGALEHNNSSMYFMPFYGEEYFQQIMKDVSAHEFFHIVTPLTLHSEEIHSFDFSNPKMSEHLWLYEGMTEYNAHLVQVRSGLITMEAYFDNIIEKMDYADTFNDTLPFTTMSKGCLGIYEDQYINVYQKGALINMCLDILIIKNSNGKKNLRDVIAALSDKFGASRAFKDDQLFDEIEKLTYPEVRKFLDLYVAGPNKIPYAEILNIVGLDFAAGGKQNVVDPGFDVQYINYDQAQDKFYIMSDEYITETGKKMKIQSGDFINKINGKELNLSNIGDVLGGFYQTAKTGDKIEYEMLRKKGSKTKKVKLKGVVGSTTMDLDKKLYVVENPSADQIMFRKAWINQ